MTDQERGNDERLGEDRLRKIRERADADRTALDAEQARVEHETETEEG